MRSAADGAGAARLMIVALERAVANSAILPNLEHEFGDFLQLIVYIIDDVAVG